MEATTLSQDVCQLSAWLDMTGIPNHAWSRDNIERDCSRMGRSGLLCTRHPSLTSAEVMVDITQTDLIDQGVITLVENEGFGNRKSNPCATLLS